MWHFPIDKLCKKIASTTGAIKRVKPFVPQSTLLNIFNILSGSFIIYSLKRAISGLILILLLVFYYSTKNDTWRPIININNNNNNNNNLTTSRALFTFTDQQRLTT